MLRCGTLCCTRVWYPAVRYDMLRYAAARYGMVCCDTVRYALQGYGNTAIRYGMLRYGTVVLRYKTVCCIRIRYAAVQHSKYCDTYAAVLYNMLPRVRYAAVLNGMLHLGTVILRYGTVRFGNVRYAALGFGVRRCGAASVAGSRLVQSRQAVFAAGVGTNGVRGWTNLCQRRPRCSCWRFRVV